MKVKRTTEEFKQEIYALVNDEYEVIGAYQGRLQKLEMRHRVCGQVADYYPHNFLAGSRCPHCQTYNRKSPAQFEREVAQKGQGDYVLLTPYQRHFVKVRMQHLRCGHDWWVLPHNFLSGTRCPKCARKKETPK